MVPVYVPGVTAIRITPGAQTFDFSLKKDINRLNEVIVTGSIEGTERSKVAYAVGRLTAEDIPVPALNPVTALQGKVAGMRVASTSGQPGSTPEILLRGPTSINATGRNTGPLLIVDGVILRNQSLNEIGGLDVETSPWSYVIRVCEGCLVDFPGVAYQDPTQGCVAVVGGESPTSGCRFGQDESVDCRTCTGSNLFCQYPGGVGP